MQQVQEGCLDLKDQEVKWDLLANVVSLVIGANRDHQEELDHQDQPVHQGLQDLRADQEISDRQAGVEIKDLVGLKDFQVNKGLLGRQDSQVPEVLRVNKEDPVIEVHLDPMGEQGDLVLLVLLELEGHLDLLVRQAGKDLEELLVQLAQEDSQDSLGHQDL